MKSAHKTFEVVVLSRFGGMQSPVQLFEGDFLLSQAHGPQIHFE